MKVIKEEIKELAQQKEIKETIEKPTPGDGWLNEFLFQGKESRPTQ